jgi:hypothetical protein
MERKDTSSPSSRHSASARGGVAVLRSVIAPKGLAPHRAGGGKSRFASLREARLRPSEGEATLFTWYMGALKGRKGGATARPTQSAWMLPLADQITEPPIRRNSPPPSREAFPPSPRRSEMAASCRLGRRWSSRLGMASHRFLPKMGSLLFLGETSPVGTPLS